MKALIELEEREGVSLLKNATYHKSYFIDENLVVVVMDLGVGMSIPLFLRNARVIEEKLGRQLGRRVKVVPRASDVRSLAAYLVYPARITGVNTVWLPDGSVEYVVRVSRFDRRLVERYKEYYERILAELLGKRVQIRLE